jgi:GMP synthase (glutamine-hydrolysing)
MDEDQLVQPGPVSSVQETAPFLIIQLRPEDETADSEYRAILRYGGLAAAECVRVRAEREGLPSIDLARYSAIIVGGSPFDVSTPAAQKTAIQRRVEAEFASLFDRLVPMDFPFLGCCSGNGLLGAYLQTPITTRFGEPVGVAEVAMTGAGRKDPLLEGLPERFPVLLGHKEACDETPRDAALLLRGERCPVQMFRVGCNVYATQFHPEGDPEGFTTRINVYRHHGYFPPETADALIASIASAETPHAREILARFVRRYRRSLVAGQR